MRFKTAAHLGGVARVALIAAATVTAWAAPPLTTIQDQLFRADGTPVSGTLVISWKAFVASDNSNIPTNLIRVPVTGGTLRLRLAPTTTAKTAASYLVQYLIDGKLTDSEVWAVPPSSTPVTIEAIRVVTPQSSGGGVNIQGTIQISDVVGLADALAERPTTGAGYLVGRVLVPDINGDLSGLMGTPQQCVHGDGSLGSCGGGAGFVDLETPSGTLDGNNAAFLLSQTPVPATSLLLFRNGLLQKQGVDYTLVASTITFQAGSVPQPGDLLAASYRVAQ